LPRYLENARNSSVITAQTVWLPRSDAQVSQAPLRKNPVIGSVEHAANGPPSTLNEGSFFIFMQSFRASLYDMGVCKRGSSDAAPFDPSPMKISAAQIKG
jgi:hypothetical protein